MRADCASETRLSVWRHGRRAGAAGEAKAHLNSLELEDASGDTNLGVVILCALYRCIVGRWGAQMRSELVLIFVVRPLGTALAYESINHQSESKYDAARLSFLYFHG